MLPARGWFSNDKIARAAAKIHSISFHRGLSIFSTLRVIRDGEINATLNPMKRFLDQVRVSAYSRGNRACRFLVLKVFDSNSYSRHSSLWQRRSQDLIEQTELGRAASGNSADSPRQAHQSTNYFTLHTYEDDVFAKTRTERCLRRFFELTVQTHQGRVAFYRLIKTWSRRLARPRCGN